MNIYVGNLSFDASENDIREAFEKFGQVSSVNVITDRTTGQPRGFGFVEMASDDEARPRAPRSSGGGGGGGHRGW